MADIRDQSSDIEVALLGGGCFWCLEAVFDRVHGVVEVVSGYAGGDLADPGYEAVCSGNTGHAEVVRVAFDPEQLTYRDLLEIFFAIHDPTTRDRQGHDVGSQYRSVIFYGSADQKAVALTLIAALDDQLIWDRPIVTEVLPMPVFYPAESYHQDYFAKHPAQPYCQAVVAPKVGKLLARFPERLKDV